MINFISIKINNNKCITFKYKINRKYKTLFKYSVIKHLVDNRKESIINDIILIRNLKNKHSVILKIIKKYENYYNR